MAIRAPDGANKYCSQTFMDEVMNLKFWKERKKFTSEEVEEKIFE